MKNNNESPLSDYFEGVLDSFEEFLKTQKVINEKLKEFPLSETAREGVEQSEKLRKDTEKLLDANFKKF